MGFIKNALLGIALYEGLKYWVRKNTAIIPEEVQNITLGGKRFVKTEDHPQEDTRHRHNLDRPEITPEL
ncbi:MAG: hypothetical protein EOO88_07505 [Pedobacter sp.]|nr:MAG: hypothetical protein EOO88_07505 [Pedobacter sp.]